MTFLSLEVGLMFNTGEKPGKGQYRCQMCGKYITLNDNTDRLPPCPDCDFTIFKKVQ